MTQRTLPKYIEEVGFNFEDYPMWNLGRFRADGTVLCYGSTRVIRPDFDTQPSDEYRKAILEYIVHACNSHKPLLTAANHALKLLRGETPAMNAQEDTQRVAEIQETLSQIEEELCSLNKG